MVSPEAVVRYPEEQARCNHVPSVPPSKQSSLPVLFPPFSLAVPAPRRYLSGAQLVTVCPVARQHFELLSPGFQVQLHPHHWGSGEMG